MTGYLIVIPVRLSVFLVSMIALKMINSKRGLHRLAPFSIAHTKIPIVVKIEIHITAIPWKATT